MRDTGRKDIKSYVLRAGRLSKLQERAVETLSGKFCIPFQNKNIDLHNLFGNQNPVVLEIGFGMGHATVEIADFEVILACVELGMGKSIIPKTIVEKLGYMDKLKITKINDDILEVPTCLVCRKDNIPKISEYLRNIDID